MCRIQITYRIPHSSVYYFRVVAYNMFSSGGGNSGNNEVNLSNT